MRIALAQVSHESNSFVPGRTPLSEFRILRSAEIPEFYRGAHNEVTGFLEGAGRFDFEAVPTFCAAALASGVVAADAFKYLARELVVALQSVGPIDGILLALHGAFVAENAPDADTQLVLSVRAVFGAGMPLVVTHDPHCNLTAGLVQAADALLMYQTNPHTDQRERGLQAARIVAGMVRGTMRPVMAYRSLPMMINIVHHHTWSPPLRPLWEEMCVGEKRPGILAASISLSYQYSDVPAMGNAIVVVANGDQLAADQLAEELAARLWALRDSLAVCLPEPGEGVSQAKAHEGPFVIVDVGDNIGGGAPGDNTVVLQELLRQQASGWVVTLADPDGVRACMAKGPGDEITLAVGGNAKGSVGGPVTITGRVKGLFDGKFEERAPRHGGLRWRTQGLTAVLAIPTQENTSYIILTEKRISPTSLQQLQSIGVNPTYMKTIVVKATIAWKAAYEPIMTGFVMADTLGVTQVNPGRSQYRHVRKNLWGLKGW